MEVTLHSIITTINGPTEAIQKLVLRLHDIDAKLYVIGDKKSPESYDIKGVEFLTLQDQLDSKFELARKLPIDHYARKNIGYLTAITQNASCIYETDDDNAPLPNWTIRQETVTAKEIEGRGWVNVYKYFTDENIWPRGFPLNEIHSEVPEVRGQRAESRGRRSEVGGQRSEDRGQRAEDRGQRTEGRLQNSDAGIRAPIQQGLVNNSPDVDAIWRLILDQSFNFRNSPSVYLSPGLWCPFNSQSTWWWPVAYPLLYLPSHCSFRMTDIWRSFIAQRCLWEMDFGVVFHAPEVYQERNIHNLMRDFQDEIPGYTRNKEFIKILDRINLRKGSGFVANNLLYCYETLVKADLFPEKELVLVNAWLEDLEAVAD